MNMEKSQTQRIAATKRWKCQGGRFCLRLSRHRPCGILKLLFQPSSSLLLLPRPLSTTDKAVQQSKAQMAKTRPSSSNASGKKSTHPNTSSSNSKGKRKSQNGVGKASTSKPAVQPRTGAEAVREYVLAQATTSSKAQASGRKNGMAKPKSKKIVNPLAELWGLGDLAKPEKASASGLPTGAGASSMGSEDLPNRPKGSHSGDTGDPLAGLSMGSNEGGEDMSRKANVDPPKVYAPRTLPYSSAFMPSRLFSKKGKPAASRRHKVTGRSATVPQRRPDLKEATIRPEEMCIQWRAHKLVDIACIANDGFVGSTKNFKRAKDLLQPICCRHSK